MLEKLWTYFFTANLNKNIQTSQLLKYLPSLQKIIWFFLNQSGFSPVDFYVNQLLAIAHELCSRLIATLKWGTFSQIYQKLFIKPEVLLLKVNRKGIFGKGIFLRCRKRVVLNGQHSSWDNVNAGVPRGSILRP